jgi:hypothetical protein
MTEPDEALLWAREQTEIVGLELVLANAYRAGAAASEARIKALEGFLRRLREWDQMNPPMTGDHAAWAASIDALLKEADQ